MFIRKSPAALLTVALVATTTFGVPSLMAANGNQHRSSSYSSYFFSDEDGEDGYAIVDGDDVTMNGNPNRRMHVDRLRDGSRPFIWFSRAGIEYVIRDDATIGAAGRILAPQRELGRRQGELGREQAELGRRQAGLGRDQALLGAEQARLGSRSMWDAQRDGRSDGSGSARAMNRDLSARMHELGERQRDLGQKQRVLGERQRELGERQRQLARETRPQLQQLFEASLRSGRAQEVR